MGISRRRFVAAAGGAVGGFVVGARTGPARLTADEPVAGPAWAAARRVPGRTPRPAGERLDVPARQRGSRRAARCRSRRTRRAAAGPTAAPGRRAVTPDGVFAAASLSKPVVATIAWTLHRTGAFDVNRPHRRLPVRRRADGPVGRRDHAPDALQPRVGTPQLAVRARAAGDPGSGRAARGATRGRATCSSNGRSRPRPGRRSSGWPATSCSSRSGMASSSYLARPDLEARVVPPYVAARTSASPSTPPSSPGRSGR